MISYTVFKELYSSASRLYAERIKGNNNLAFLDNWENEIKDLFTYYGSKTSVNFDLFATSISNIEHGKKIIVEKAFHPLNSPVDFNANNEMAQYKEISKAIIAQLKKFKKSVFGSSIAKLKDIHDKVNLLHKRFKSVLAIDSFSFDTAYQLYTCFQEVKYYIYLELIHQNADLKKFYGNDIEEEEIIYSIYLDVQKLVADVAILAQSNDLKKLLDELQQKVRAYGTEDHKGLCKTLYQIHALKERPINYITTAVSENKARDCLNTSYINEAGKRVIISEYSLSDHSIPLLMSIAKERKSNVPVGYYNVGPEWNALEIADYNVYFLIKTAWRSSKLSFVNSSNCLTNNLIITYRDETISDSNIERILEVKRDWESVLIEEYKSKINYERKKSSMSYRLSVDSAADLICGRYFTSSDGQKIRVITTITLVRNNLFSWEREISIDGQNYKAKGQGESISEILFREHENFDTSLYLKSR